MHPALQKLSHYLTGENEPATEGVVGGRMRLREGIRTLSLDGQSCRACLPGLPPDECRYVYYYAFLPNLLLSLHPDYVMMHTLWPRGVGRTEIVCDWLFHPDALAEPGFDPDDVVAFWDVTNRQDWHVCEQMQLGLTSRGVPARTVFSSRGAVVWLRPAHSRPGTNAISRVLRHKLGGRQSPVSADSFDGAFLERRRTGGLLGRTAGLVKNKTMASGVVAPEILRCGLAAEVAVYARYVHVKEAGHVFRYFFSSVGHCAFFLVRAGSRSKRSKSERGIRSAGFERIPLFYTTFFARFHLAPIFGQGSSGGS